MASFLALSNSTDESTDIACIAQLAIFICGVDVSLAVAGESVESLPMTGMTKADDIFNSLADTLDNDGGDWARPVTC